MALRSIQALSDAATRKLFGSTAELEFTRTTETATATKYFSLHSFGGPIHRGPRHAANFHHKLGHHPCLFAPLDIRFEVIKASSVIPDFPRSKASSAAPALRHQTPKWVSYDKRW